MVQTKHPSAVISAHNLQAAYGSRIIWQDVTLSVAPGEFIGLLGPNGSGKTTLFRILLGLQKPSAGLLHVFGKVPTQGNNMIGYVPQRREIDQENRINSLEYVRLGINGNHWGVSLPSQVGRERSTAMSALEEVDGGGLAYRPLSQLSGGEAQRVFLAQALVSRPKLLLLDEPLASLDLKRENQLLSLIHNLTKRYEMATLLIAHDINPLLPYVDRIMYIAGGGIATGKPADIITSQTLSQLYNAPVEVLLDSQGRVAVLGVSGEEHHV